MLKRFFSSRWCVAAAAILGVLLSLPSLKTGLIGDDFFHWDLFTGHVANAHPGSPFGMFSFTDGNPERTHEYMKKGVFPWWSADTVKLSFWRPLAEWSHWLDYRLWPDSPALMHAHNIFWYGLVIVMLGIWLRAIDNNKARAGVATLIYAISALHGTAIGWIANRNAFIAAFLSLITLTCFHYASRNAASARGRAGVFYGLSCAVFAVSLLAGESSIATTTYLFAYALLLNRHARFVPRMVALIPFALIVLVWKHFYSQFGYGSHASGVYIDPAAEIGRFVPIAAMRLPVLLFAQLFGVPSALFNFMMELSQQLVYVGIALAALIIFGSALRAMNLLRDSQAQFYALGMVLSAAPVCATATDDRLLTFVGFGGSGLLATFICAVFEKFKTLEGAKGIAIKVFAFGLALLHFGAMPYSLPSSVGVMKRMMAPYIEYSAISLPQDKITANSRVVLINPPLPSCVAYLPFVRDYHGLTNPRATLTLASGSRPIALEVIDEKNLQVTASEGFITPLDNFFRDPKLPFMPGEQIDLGDVKVHIVEVFPEGQAKVARFEFVNGLSDADLQFYVWDHGKYRELQLPPQKEKIDFPVFKFDDQG